MGKWKRKIIKQGDSAAVTLPSAILAAKGWKIGDEVDITEANDHVVIRRAEKQK